MLVIAYRMEPQEKNPEAISPKIIDLEVLFSVKNHAEHDRVRRRRSLAYDRVAIDDSTFDRAIEVQNLLARKGQHRLPIPDLIIAAAAERAGLVVLHYDADFDRIRAVTSQACEWVVPRGSVR